MRRVFGDVSPTPGYVAEYCFGDAISALGAPMFAELAKWWKRIGNPTSASPQAYRVYTTEFDRIIHGDELPALLDPEQEAAFEVKVSEVDPVLSRWRAAAELAAVEEGRAYASKHGGDDLNDTVAC